MFSKLQDKGVLKVFKLALFFNPSNWFLHFLYTLYLNKLYGMWWWKADVKTEIKPDIPHQKPSSLSNANTVINETQNGMCNPKTTTDFTFCMDVCIRGLIHDLISLFPFNLSPLMPFHFSKKEQ
jgi:hypothetical protein